MFDLLIKEVAAKFGLGNKAGSILSALLGLMFQKQSGGLGGLLDLFKQKGLASIASTWLGGGKGLPLGINPRQLKNVIGGALVKEIASKTGLGSGPIGGALAFMLPKIVRALTPDGVIPAGIPSAIGQIPWRNGRNSGGERLPVVVDIDSSDSPARLVRDAQVGRRAAASRAIGFER